MQILSKVPPNRTGLFRCGSAISSHLLGYTEDLADEQEIAATIEVDREDYGPDWMAA